jgi:hypothetical protein
MSLWVLSSPAATGNETVLKHPDGVVFLEVGTTFAALRQRFSVCFPVETSVKNDVHTCDTLSQEYQHLNNKSKYA